MFTSFSKKRRKSPAASAAAPASSTANTWLSVRKIPAPITTIASSSLGSAFSAFDSNSLDLLAPARLAFEDDCDSGDEDAKSRKRKKKAAAATAAAAARSNTAISDIDLEFALGGRLDPFDYTTFLERTVPSEAQREILTAYGAYSARTDAHLKEIREHSEAFEARKISHTITSALHKWQVDGVRWMVEREKLGLVGTQRGKPANGDGGRYSGSGLIADDMGLGKTLMILALTAAHQPEITTRPLSETGGVRSTDHIDTTLVLVTPITLVDGWLLEAHKHTDNFNFTIRALHGAKDSKWMKKTPTVDIALELRDYDLVVTSYSFVHNNMDSLHLIKFRRIVLDEADDKIRNPRTKIHKSVCNLQADFRWCLTGTPINNSLTDLYAIAKFLRFAPYSSHEVWKAYIEDHKDANMYRQQLCDQMMLRRTKGELRGGKLGGSCAPPLDPPSLVSGSGIATGQSGSGIASGELGSGIAMDESDGSIATGESGNTSNHPGGFKGGAQLPPCPTPFRHTRTVVKVDVELGRFERAVYDYLLKRSKREFGKDFDLQAVVQHQAVHGLNLRSNYAVLERILRMRQCCDHPALLDARYSTILRKILHKDQLKQQEREDFEEATRQIAIAMRGGDNDAAQQNVLQSIEGTLDRRVQWNATVAAAAAGGTPHQHISALEHENGALRGSCAPGGSCAPPLNPPSSFRPRTNELTLEPSGGPRGAAAPLPLPLPAKVRAVVRLVHEALFGVEGKVHKVVVFSQWVLTLKIIHEALEASFSALSPAQKLKFPTASNSKPSIVQISGAMERAERLESIQRLTHEAHSCVMLATTGSCQRGLNLAAASRVIIVEPWWNPKVEEQAMDRVDRADQTKNIVIYRLVCTDTVEEMIYRVQRSKDALSNGILKMAEMGSASAARVGDLQRT